MPSQPTSGRVGVGTLDPPPRGIPGTNEEAPVLTPHHDFALQSDTDIPPTSLVVGEMKRGACFFCQESSRDPSNITPPREGCPVAI